MFEREYTTDCGVTIHKPDASDYGTWRCLVKTDGSKAFGRVLKVTPSMKSKLVPQQTTKSEDVHVKRGDSLTVGNKINLCNGYHCLLQKILIPLKKKKIFSDQVPDERSVELLLVT